MGKTFEGIERPAPEVEAFGLLQGEAIDEAQLEAKVHVPPVKTEAEALLDVQSALANLAKVKAQNG